MRRKKRNRDIEPLSAVLLRDRLVKNLPMEEQAPVSPKDWAAAVGSRIAARTRPMRLERGVLQVATASAAWAQELSLLSEAILIQLRRLEIDVRALRFRVSRVDPPARPPATERRSMPPMVTLPDELASAVEAIEAPELRDAIRRAAGRSLGWTEMAERMTRKAGPRRRPT